MIIILWFMQGAANATNIFYEEKYLPQCGGADNIKKLVALYHYVAETHKKFDHNFN